MKYESRKRCLKEAGKNDGRSADSKEAWRAAINGSAGTERCKWREEILTCMRGVKEHTGGMNRGMAGGEGEKEGKEERGGLSVTLSCLSLWLCIENLSRGCPRLLMLSGLSPHSGGTIH